MKTRFYIVLFLMALAGTALSNDLLIKAEKAYDSKKYKEAISCYEKLIVE